MSVFTAHGAYDNWKRSAPEEEQESVPMYVISDSSAGANDKWQTFATTHIPSADVGQDDWDILLTGPKHPHYGEASAAVERSWYCSMYNAKLRAVQVNDSIFVVCESAD
jgi:hypothetical protein